MIRKLIRKSTRRFQKNLIDIIQNEIAPLLRDNSFAQKGNTFFRVHGDLVKFIDLEYLRWNSASSLRFWFTASLFVGDFSNEKNIDFKALLRNGDSVFCKRCGSFWGDDRHMYRLSHSSDRDSLASEITGHLRQYILPFYNKFSSFDDILSFFSNENRNSGSNEYSFLLAVILAKKGRMEESKRFFLESPGDREAIKNSALIHGINLD
ncbi:MAG: DUF4304 domain-containing protein [bacterium]|nr:DUF4304 domain-containing protein [bacterium]